MENGHTSEALRIAALDHARAMTTQASELRTKNFNFFLVIMGVIMAAYVNVGRENARLALCAIGVLVSLVFLLLDIRGRELLDAAKKELAVKELELGITIQATLQQMRIGKPIRKLISHTFVYRVIYIVGLILSVSLAIFVGN